MQHGGSRGAHGMENPRSGHYAAGLIAVPGVHFEGAFLHFAVVKVFAAAINAGGGLLQSRVV